MGAFQSIMSPSPEQAALLQANLPAACGEAARLLLEADVFLLFTGAGFSADSGLAVYADVAKVGAYADRGLSYHDICHPKWLKTEPELFWGFWGQCFNDYRNTAPHDGYEILDRWAESRFRHSPVAKSIRDRLGSPPAPIPEEGVAEPCPPSFPPPYEVKEKAGAFFVFTSNVDAHHFDWFRACEIRECHGNTELYQCAGPSDEHGPPLCQGVWRAPPNFRFEVDKTTMLAPQVATSQTTQLEKGQYSDSHGATPCIGHVLGSSRVTTLRYLETADAKAKEPQKVSPQAAAPTVAKPSATSAPKARATSVPKAGVRAKSVPKVAVKVKTEVKLQAPDVKAPFAENHPCCKMCGGPGRPAILMFGDGSWLDVRQQEDRWNDWNNLVTRDLPSERADRTLNNGEEGVKPLKVLVMEIGAGGNVRTVRSMAESALRKLVKNGAEAKLVRINPDLPLGDSELTQDGGELERFMLPVMGRGLECLKMIDAAAGAIGMPQRP